MGGLTRRQLGMGFVIGAVAAGAIGCNSDSTGPAEIASIRIEPHEALELAPGDSHRFRAVAADAGGSPLSGISFVWRVEDAGVATVDESGLVTALAPGSTRIVASAGAFRDEVPIAVETPVARMNVAPASTTIIAGKTIQLVAQAEDANGQALAGRAITWESSDELVVTVSVNGLVTALSPGTAKVSASGGGQLATVTVTVLVPIAGLHIEPASAALHPGDSLQLKATSVDSHGNVLPGRTTAWSTSDPQIGVVSSSGLLLAKRVGTAFVVAEAEGQRDSVSVTVQASVGTVKVRPNQTTLQPGGTVQLAAILKDATGNPLSGRQVTWASSDAGVATVSATGLSTAVGVGVATIEATSEGRAGQGTITVQDPVGTVTVTPATTALTVGQDIQLVATLRSAHGGLLTGRDVVWSSGAGGVATVSSSGRVVARAPGSGTIVARSEGVEGRATINVSEAVTGGADDAAVLVGAGDIGTCIGDGDEATAKLLDRIPGTVFAAGDNVYNHGTADEFAHCYDPTWGRHKARTRPVPGNHDYETPGAAGYFGYFGAAAGDPDKGYYSYEVGAWHVLTLNSNIPANFGSAQAQWIAADLDAHPTACTVAIWHHPVFSSDSGSIRMRDAWQILYQHGAEIVISGHHHNYERFAPQTTTGQLDVARGIRQFVVGTGGRGVGGLQGPPAANTEMRYGGGFGVLKLTLHSDWYEWEFISEAGKTFSDKGSQRCH